MADQKAQQDQIQNRTGAELLDLAEYQDADHRTDHTAVNGDAALPDIQAGDGVVLKAVPGEGTVVNTGADDGKGNDPQNTVQQIVLLQTELLAPAHAVDHSQQQTQGDDQAVEPDVQRAQGQSVARIDLNAQIGENDGIIHGKPP